MSMNLTCDYCKQVIAAPSALRPAGRRPKVWRLAVPDRRRFTESELDFCSRLCIYRYLKGKLTRQDRAAL